MNRILNIGSVPYLNAKPFLKYLEGTITLEIPSILAQSFRQGKYDLALIPIVECMLEKNVTILDRVAIGCQGPVYSVILVLEQPIHSVRTIAVDAASLTSVTLLKILLRKYWKINPEILEDGQKADAQLIIGDRALIYREQFPQANLLDLGSVWRSYTGLPFVFAVWAIHPKAVLDLNDAEDFRMRCLKGLADKKEFSDLSAEPSYLTEWIRYDLGQFQKSAIQRFAYEIAEAKIFSDVVNTDFVYC